MLIAQGYFQDKEDAVRWILAGKVIVDGQMPANSGIKVGLNADIMVKDIDRRYVGRGGDKLEGALKGFSCDLNGVVALDAGASRGGFTDCLLKHGAAKVYSVDVGYGQLAGALRVDSRVVNMEKTNISQVRRDRLDPIPSVATIDLSYLSLRQAMPIVSSIVCDDGSMICLVKPLFEIDDARSRRSGIIVSKQAYVDILESLVDFTPTVGLFPVDIIASPITGNKGTREFFFYVGKSRHQNENPNIEERILQAVNAL